MSADRPASPRQVATNDVTLYGIQWGGGTTSFGPIVVFSPLSNIESELGPLIVTAP